MARRRYLFDPPRKPGVRGATVLARHRPDVGPRPPTYGRHYSALAHLGAEVRGELECAEAWLELGRIALLQGEIEEATGFVCHGLLLGTPHPDAVLLMSQVLVCAGRLQDASDLLASSCADRDREEGG
jgi:hypothetical protein